MKRFKNFYITGAEIIRDGILRAGDVTGHDFHGNQWTDGDSRFDQYGDGKTDETNGKHVTEYENEGLNRAELRQKANAQLEDHDQAGAAETLKHSQEKLSATARSASRAANAATRTAKTISEHNAADELHSKAGNLHSMAAESATRSEQFKDKANKHFNAASQHFYQAAAHGSTAIALDTPGGRERNPDGHTISKVRAEEQTMKTTKNFAVRATRIVSKLSATVRADAADVVVLDDLREAVSAAAKGDDRFNRTAAGSPADGNWTPWCTSIEFDQDDATWAAVVNAADGKFYRVGFEFSTDGKVSLSDDGQQEVTRKTEWVAARCLFNDVDVVAAGDVEGHEFHGNQFTPANGQTAEHMGKTFKYNEETGRWHYKSGEPVNNQGIHDKLNEAARTGKKSGNAFTAGTRGGEAVREGLNPKPYNHPEGRAAEANTDDAQARSKMANATGKPEDHEAAADAHRQAVRQHVKAAVMSDTASQNKYHAQMATKHQEAQTHHLAESMASRHGIKTLTARQAAVRAAGNSGGAQAGHYARKADAAKDASKEAHDASSEAHDSGDDADHEVAAEAHSRASGAHSAAMVAAAKAGKTDDAKRHAQLMNMHDACADAHAGDDDAAVEAASAALSEAINGGSANGSTVDDMDKDAVHCRASTGVRIQPTEAWSTGQEAKMVYLPAGISTICAGFRDGAINLTVDVDEDTAKTVQKSYDDLRASYPKLEPFFCFEHREEEASFHPRRFEWGEVRGEQGVLAAGEPTELGATNVNGRVHRTFSPSFTTDAEYGKAVERNGVLSFPDGVRGSKTNPAKITGIAFCAGTLTNKPAFKNMPPVKAKAATPPEPKKRPTSEEVFARISKTQSEQPEAVRAKKIEDIFARVGGKTGAPPSK